MMPADDPAALLARLSEAEDVEAAYLSQVHSRRATWISDQTSTEAYGTYREAKTQLAAASARVRQLLGAVMATTGNQRRG